MVTCACFGQTLSAACRPTLPTETLCSSTEPGSSGPSSNTHARSVKTVSSIDVPVVVIANVAVDAVVVVVEIFVVVALLLKSIVFFLDV